MLLPNLTAFTSLNYCVMAPLQWGKSPINFGFASLKFPSISAYLPTLNSSRYIRWPIVGSTSCGCSRLSSWALGWNPSDTFGMRDSIDWMTTYRNCKERKRNMATRNSTAVGYMRTFQTLRMEDCFFFFKYLFWIGRNGNV